MHGYTCIYVEQLWKYIQETITVTEWLRDRWRGVSYFTVSSCITFEFCTIYGVITSEKISFIFQAQHRN